MPIDLEKLSLPSGSIHKVSTAMRKPECPKVTKPIRGRFLKGPVPLAWLVRASCLPGKTLEVSVVLWFLAGVTKSRRVALPNKVMSEFGVDRFAKRRALIALATVGLILVSQSTGRSPLIEILDTSDEV